MSARVPDALQLRHFVAVVQSFAFRLIVLLSFHKKGSMKEKRLEMLSRRWRSSCCAGGTLNRSCRVQANNHADKLRKICLIRKWFIALPPFARFRLRRQLRPLLLC